jgi:hypothetical protein
MAENYQEIQLEHWQVAPETAGDAEFAPPQDDFRTAYLEQLRQQPGIVPEMIEGDSLSEIAESVKRAKEAYKRIAGELATKSQVPPVPAGGYQSERYEQATLFNLDGVGKIAYGIAKRGK